MDADEFYALKVKKAKDFGFPEPIYINAERLSNKNHVIYLVEIQATHIPNKAAGTTHHFSLKFSKFKKVKESPFWEEVELTSHDGFSISDKASIEKLAAYIKANQALLQIDILSKEYTNAFFSNNDVTIKMLQQILHNQKNKELAYELFKEQYPDLDKRLLLYKLAQTRSKALQEFKGSLDDKNKSERNYWQPFLEKNRWMFGLTYFVLLDDRRIDLWDTADYIFEAEDGFIDIVEIKHPHVDFWEKDSTGNYKKYRNFLQPSQELNGAITQAINYIFQIEKKFSDPDWVRKNKCETPVKPCCTIIFGRSNNWGIEEKTAFRLLNDSLHGVSIITFDHLYSRAAKLLDTLEKED